MLPAHSIRLAEIDDAIDILDIYNVSIESGISTGHVQKVELSDVLDWLDLATARRPFWVLEIAGQVVAWANADDFHGLPIFSDCAEIGVYVLPTFHRQGIANSLLEHVQIELEKQGTSHLVALIFAENNASLNLFAKHEFQPWGVYPQVAKVNGKQHDIHVLGKMI
ncbi:GNAT family N-acetyltransferase [Marinomonas agarivorans]|nr:GNAT family N-acetyltransferase [Marinomonas agarivorans]